MNDKPMTQCDDCEETIDSKTHHRHSSRLQADFTLCDGCAASYDDLMADNGLMIH